MNMSEMCLTAENLFEQTCWDRWWNQSQVGWVWLLGTIRGEDVREAAKPGDGVEDQQPGGEKEGCHKGVAGEGGLAETGQGPSTR